MIGKLLAFLNRIRITVTIAPDPQSAKAVDPEPLPIASGFDKTGWSRWPMYGESGWVDYPTHNCPIEIMRDEYEKPHLILDSRQLSPAFNIAGLYWRKKPIFMTPHEEELAQFDKELKASRPC